MENTKLRERNRRRRQGEKSFSIRYVADFFAVASIGLIIGGWAAALPVLYAIAGILLLAVCAVSLFDIVPKLLKLPRGGREFKAQLTVAVFYTVFAALALFTCIYAFVTMA